ncbi:siderophore-interacting protein [Pseudonocardia cypriaca]|uniref:NADPH-dependent ferric siderophore reductase n=1 Tax=Pseudonocardia cypriaca TaxID=882449 RepID=A0A543GG15_9PSEU|nr:siderophore-interacting protein [Pseudonocardia cypriaca]TQM45028.1 NADPH-dependent ferric siderophore reductase [Pseudonocardia cypriaca]
MTSAPRAAQLPDLLDAAKTGPGGVKVPYPIGIRELVVLRTAWLGPAMLRLTLGGPGIAGFQSHVPEEHVRLVFPDERGELRLPEQNGDVLRWPRPMPVSREYTVRRHDPTAGELDVDVAVHPGGVASDWAVAVEPGDRIHVAGPPGGFVVPSHYDRYLLAGDLTALPQIARYLEGLPPAATGWAFVEVRDRSEEIPLTAPSGVTVRWVHRGSVPAGTGDDLERAVRSVELPAGERTFVWVAAEAGVVKPLRRWVRDRGVPTGDFRIVGYWKRGVADFDDEE